MSRQEDAHSDPRVKNMPKSLMFWAAMLFIALAWPSHAANTETPASASRHLLLQARSTGSAKSMAVQWLMN